MFDLTGKVALVTGATGGIGGSIARALHAAGATVVLTGRRQEVLDQMAAEIDGSIAVAADFNQDGAAQELIKQVEEKAGKIDILVNNAGLTRDGLSMRMSNEDWMEVIEVNLTASFRLIRAAMKGMMKRRNGRIVNISSVVGAIGNPGQANYAASKAGLVGMSKSIAAEIASRGVTVNNIAPGFIETAMTDALSDDQKKNLLQKVPAGRLGQPDEIAAAVVFLASNEAAYMTGETIHINGGMAML
ncbi:MAG: 3-oxoacyl-[acyl-carrier-protein] reductase [Alphaproteobacteria bacterium]